MSDEQRKALYDQGLCDGDIAEACGVVGSTIARWRKKHGLPSHYARGGRKREKVVNSHLVRQRSMMYALGFSFSEIADQQGVSRSAISQWFDRKRRLEIAAAGQAVVEAAIRYCEDGANEDTEQSLRAAVHDFLIRAEGASTRGRRPR